MLLSVYIELASGKETMMLFLYYYVEGLCLNYNVMLEVTCVYNVMHCSVDAGHTVLALEIIKKHCLLFLLRADKKTSKIKLSRQ